MTQEKLNQANEKSAAIDRLERKVRELARISSKTESCQQSFYLRADNRVAIPKELESVFDALLGDYYKKKLEKAKKEFEEM